MAGKHITINDSIGSLSDVNMAGLTPDPTGSGNDMILKWNQADGEFQAALDLSGTGSSTLASLTDTTITSVAKGDMLFYDTTGTVWKNLAAGTAGNVLTSGGVGEIPTWSETSPFKRTAGHISPTESVNDSLSIGTATAIGGSILTVNGNVSQEGCYTFLSTYSDNLVTSNTGVGGAGNAVTLTISNINTVKEGETLIMPDSVQATVSNITATTIDVTPVIVTEQIQAIDGTGTPVALTSFTNDLPIKIHPEETSGQGRLTFEGNTGGLLTIIDDKDNELWTASDVSGNPIGYIDADWNVRFGNPFNLNDDQSTVGTKGRPLEMRYDNASGDTFISMHSLPTHANNGDAVTAGLLKGDIYKTSTGDLKITF